MKKLIASAFLVGTVTLGTQAFAQPICNNSYEIMTAAHNLEEEAFHFADQVRYEDGYTHLASDAEAYAEEAEHFHEAVETGANCAHMQADFYEVTAAGRHLRREWRHAHDAHHNRHLERDYNALEYAYHQLARAVVDSDHGGGHRDGRIIIRGQ
jgi:hypothetical protein